MKPLDATDPFYEGLYTEEMYARDKANRPVIVKKYFSNGGFEKLKGVVFMVVVLGAGALIWSMNMRMTRLETLMVILAQKLGVNVQ